MSRLSTCGLASGIASGLACVLTCILSACAPKPLTPLQPRPTTATGTPHEGVSTATMGRARIGATIDALVTAPSFRTASWGILVVNDHDDIVYARNAATLMTPASNMKIITGAIALTKLGPDFRFRQDASTLVLRDTVPRDFGPMYDTLVVRDTPMRELLARTLKPSQNRLAEQLFYTIGLEATGVISRDSAAAVERRQLAAWGIPADGAIVRDGSGYDRANYLSAETIVRILTIMRSDAQFQAWYDAFPIAGVDGTLASRMRATAAERNAHAKTGSLGAVRALSGYVTTTSGERLTFSIICNGFTTPPETVTGTIDHIVAALAVLPPVSRS